MLVRAMPTFIDYPPMQAGTSFNLDALKAEIQKKMDEARAACEGAAQ